MLAKISTLTVSHFENGKNNLRLSSIINILEVLGMNDSRYIDFSNSKAHFDGSRSVIIFLGLDRNTKKIECAISFEALDDRFGDNQNHLKTFLANQNFIYNEINKKYLHNQFETNGSILIRSEDLC